MRLQTAESCCVMPETHTEARVSCTVTGVNTGIKEKSLQRDHSNYITSNKDCKNSLHSKLKVPTYI